MSSSAASVDVTCYYYTPVKVPLLRGAVLPALRAACTGPVRGHLERHWLHGPHVRVRLYGPAPAVTAAAAGAAARMRAYLDDHPSDSALDAPALLERSRASGLAELVTGPYEPIYPDNTVRVTAADDRHLLALLSSRPAIERRADLLRAGVHPVGHSVAYLAERGNTADTRVWLTLTAMAAHAAGYPPGIAGGYQSFLSHLEDFLYLHDRDGRLRARLAREWHRRGATVTAHVARIADDAAAGADPLVPAWAAWVRAAWVICAPAWRRGELPLPGPEYARQARSFGDAAVRRWDPDERTGYSGYHAALARTDFLSLPGVAEHFGPYRFATNVLYLLLVLCDVTPIERYVAAYLLSQAVQEITGVTWQQAMASHAGGQESGPDQAEPGQPGDEAVPGHGTPARPA